AVFYNRLKKGMRLQSDPTIIYGITGGAGALGRGITKAEIDTKTPYNTYQINGLPPGPIANPGKAALEATFNPAKTNDLYFVADGTGGHAFSETLKDHNSAVQKWRQVEKQAKSKSDDDNKDLPLNPDVTPIPEVDEPAPEQPKASTAKSVSPPKAADGSAPTAGTTSKTSTSKIVTPPKTTTETKPKAP
ncbi:MAG: endolytic transglycosylase MltG, partial [Hyphomicrobium sp.]